MDTTIKATIVQAAVQPAAQPAVHPAALRAARPARDLVDGLLQPFSFHFDLTNADAFHVYAQQCAMLLEMHGADTVQMLILGLQLSKKSMGRFWLVSRLFFLSHIR